jgi:hypothetical protein
MIKFINMDFNGSQWWVDYEENSEIKRNYYNTFEEAEAFYLLIIQ